MVILIITAIPRGQFAVSIPPAVEIVGAIPLIFAIRTIRVQRIRASLADVADAESRLDALHVHQRIRQVILLVNNGQSLRALHFDGLHLFRTLDGERNRVGIRVIHRQRVRLIRCQIRLSQKSLPSHNLVLVTLHKAITQCHHRARLSRSPLLQRFCRIIHVEVIVDCHNVQKRQRVVRRIGIRQDDALAIQFVNVGKHPSVLNVPYSRAPLPTLGMSTSHRGNCHNKSK